jgi:hypothetical protein
MVVDTATKPLIGIREPTGGLRDQNHASGYAE